MDEKSIKGNKPSFIDHAEKDIPVLANQKNTCEVKNMPVPTNHEKYIYQGQVLPMNADDEQNTCGERNIPVLIGGEKDPLLTDHGKYSCDVCEKAFRNKKCLAIHQLTHTGENPHICKICKKAFSKKIYLYRHLHIHLDVNPQVYDLHQDEINTKSNSTRPTCANSEKFVCDVCKKEFRLKRALAKHMHFHIGDKPFVCEICQKAFSQSSKLIEHSIVHTDEKQSYCDLCKKAFRSKKYLATHMLIHTGENPFVCEICRKAFNKTCHLSRHMRIHSGVKPYSCEICAKTFNQKCHLTQHMKVHTGEKPHACGLCRKTFSQKCSLDLHLLIHSGIKPFVCDICQRAFNQKSILNQHRNTHFKKVNFLLRMAKEHPEDFQLNQKYDSMEPFSLQGLSSSGIEPDTLDSDDDGAEGLEDLQGISKESIPFSKSFEINQNLIEFNSVQDLPLSKINPRSINTNYCESDGYEQILRMSKDSIDPSACFQLNPKHSVESISVQSVALPEIKSQTIGVDYMEADGLETLW